jgi:shikimate dehydrogenase
LIGYPLSHSFSKKYFNDRFEREAITNSRYENFPISSISELPALIHAQPALKGVNVTIPYKEAVIPFLSEKNDVVAAIGACNCIKITGGHLSGFNTDVLGFERSLKKHLTPAHKKALIFGTGGAAKAVAYVLSKAGIEYSFVTRKKEPDLLSISYGQINPEMLSSHLLLINTTPLGMYPDTETAPDIDYHLITRSHYLFDLTYNPEKTLFLRRGEANGAVIQNGYEMLIIQAEESWRIWNEK